MRSKTQCGAECLAKPVRLLSVVCAVRKRSHEEEDRLGTSVRESVAARARLRRLVFVNVILRSLASRGAQSSQVSAISRLIFLQRAPLTTRSSFCE